MYQLRIADTDYLFIYFAVFISIYLSIYQPINLSYVRRRCQVKEWEKKLMQQEIGVDRLEQCCASSKKKRQIQGRSLIQYTTKKTFSSKLVTEKLKKNMTALCKWNVGIGVFWGSGEG